MTLKSFIFLFFLFTLCIACSDDSSDSQDSVHGIDVVNLKDPWRNLESYSYTFNSTLVKNELKSKNLADLLSHVQYDVSVHHFTYQTKYKGSTITASGAIAIPIGKPNPSILVYHHGTMFYDNDTPSMQVRNSSWGMELSAAGGYITFLPDYIGYGSTAEILHPYHLYRPTVDASIDMIIAGSRFLEENKIVYSDNGIYLAGFSEGGYAAFAVQKEIETHPELDLKLKASAPGAGAYDVGYQFSITTDHDLYPGPGYMGLALCAYNEYYIHKPLAYYFNHPYEVKMMDLISGKYTEEFVNSNLPNRLSELLEPAFLKGYKTDPTNVFSIYLEENNLNNFIVQTPTRFIHGTRDETVPYPVATKAYGDLIQLGTSPEILKIDSFEGGHDEVKYLDLMLDWFNLISE